MSDDSGHSEIEPSSAAHIPVLYQEVMEWLVPRPGRRYIDGTVGLGGHAQGILNLSSPDGRLLGLDRDPQALAHARSRLSSWGERVVLIQGRHEDLASLARSHGFGQVSGILFDLGVSSLQLEDPARGFSFQRDGPLDMRMGPDAKITAAEIVNTWSVEELTRILWEYGEERRAHRVARAICARRPLRSTRELADLVASVIGSGGRIHPATRTFQALRIAVNGELDSLRAVLPQAVDLLTGGGRLVVISFHSLEDRIVKQFIVRESKDCICPPRIPQCVCGHSAILKTLTRKPFRATREEIVRNPRGRSARLRVAERLGSHR